jgi:hypothetical protein
MYVKFVSKPSEWFDVDTEVFDATICDWGRTLKRMTQEDYENVWVKAGHILGRGLRNNLWDEELCPLEEFEIYYTKDQYNER